LTLLTIGDSFTRQQTGAETFTASRPAQFLTRGEPHMALNDAALETTLRLTLALIR
jgi:hypothetical protein